MTDIGERTTANKMSLKLFYICNVEPKDQMDLNPLIQGSGLQIPNSIKTKGMLWTWNC